MKYIIPAMLCCMAIMACKKNSYTSGTAPTDTAMQYAINGILSRNIKGKDSVKTTLVVLHMAGKAEELTLSVEGLPENATATLSKPSGTPPFNTAFDLRMQSTPGGTYNLAVVATTASGIKKNHNFTLNVKGDSVYTLCQDAMVGTYTNRDSAGTNNTTTTITATGKNLLHLTDLFPEFGNREDFDGWVECDKKIIHITRKDVKNAPTSSGASVGGLGTFTKDSIYITLIRAEYETGSSQVDYYYYKRTLARK